MHAGRKIPWNLFSPKVPFRATLVPNHQHPQMLMSTGDFEIHHLTLSHHGKVKFLEGQSIGVLPTVTASPNAALALVRLMNAYESSYPKNFRYSSVDDLVELRNQLLKDGEELWNLLQKPSTHLLISGGRDLDAMMADSQQKRRRPNVLRDVNHRSAITMNVEAWFRQLPPDEFQPFETQLREALIGVAAKAQDFKLPGGRFPLQAWIDRRLGGEVRATVEKNFLEIALIPTAPLYTQHVGTDEAFFAGLKDDSFSKDWGSPMDEEEEALRESIFDFLAAWSSPDWAKIHDLSSDANVRGCCKNFLPSSVALGDWIERRIGGEIEIDQDRAARAERETDRAPTENG
eukprot:g28164.t1